MLLTGLVDDEDNLTIQLFQESQQFPLAEAAKMSIHQVRDFALGDTEQSGNLALSQFAGLQYFQHFDSNLSACQKLVGILQAYISKDVARAFITFDF